MKRISNTFVLIAGALVLALAVILPGGCYDQREVWSMDSGKSQDSGPGNPTGGGASPGAELAIFGAGCFWGVEAAFRQVDGVTDAAVGYSGGHLYNPSYRDVCSGDTGHAEVVQVRFDPAKVSYGELLDVFWKIHDPTTLNRQGPDVGDQYRSVIFYRTPEQQKAAWASREALERSGRYQRPIVTAIEPFERFWRAEEYHQRYFEKHGGAGCRFLPGVATH